MSNIKYDMHGAQTMAYKIMSHLNITYGELEELLQSFKNTKTLGSDDMNVGLYLCTTRNKI